MTASECLTPWWACGQTPEHSSPSGSGARSWRLPTLCRRPLPRLRRRRPRRCSGMAGTPTSSQASAPTWAWSSPYSRCADARGASGSTERDPVAGADRCGGGGGGGWAVAVGAVGSRQQAGSRQAGGRSARCSTHGPLPPCAAPVAIPAPPCMQIIQHLRHYSEPVFQVGWGGVGVGGVKRNHGWVGEWVGQWAGGWGGQWAGGAGGGINLPTAAENGCKLNHRRCCPLHCKALPRP